MTRKGRLGERGGGRGNAFRIGLKNDKKLTRRHAKELVRETKKGWF